MKEPDAKRKIKGSDIFVVSFSGGSKRNIRREHLHFEESDDEENQPEPAHNRHKSDSIEDADSTTIPESTSNSVGDFDYHTDSQPDNLDNDEKHNHDTDTEDTSAISHVPFILYLWILYL